MYKADLSRLLRPALYIIKHLHRLWKESLATKKRNEEKKEELVEQQLLQLTIKIIIAAATDKENLHICKEIWQNSICKDILQKELEDVAFQYWSHNDKQYKERT